jgi:small subunit ribosomal protein S18
MMQRKRRPSTRVARADKSLTFSYKEVGVLEKYLSEQGYIVPRAKTGLSQKQQRQLARAIKQARHLALLPFTQTL